MSKNTDQREVRMWAGERREGLLPVWIRDGFLESAVLKRGLDDRGTFWRDDVGQVRACKPGDRRRKTYLLRSTESNRRRSSDPKGTINLKSTGVPP